MQFSAKTETKDTPKLGPLNEVKVDILHLYDTMVYTVLLFIRINVEYVRKREATNLQ